MIQVAPKTDRRRPRANPPVTSTTKAIPHLLQLFRRMAQEVPAYRKFLKKSKVRPDVIRSIEDLAKVPIISKNNYLKEYAYKEFFWGGSLLQSHILTSTSGSTGEPFYFARSHTVDEQAALIHERFFLQSSLSQTQPTLVIVCFGMGVWIGGLITYQAFQLLATRGHPISVITPGINKVEIFKILKQLAPQYKQIIIAGYPPFIKDLLDEAHEAGISLQNHRVGLLFAAEAFTEQFRGYVSRKAHIKNEITDTMNIYGSADLGTMAFETPLSILIRKIAVEKTNLFTDLFGGITKTPTLAQYIPTFTSFEERDGQLLVSADSAMPLFRYAIGDNGGVYSFLDIENHFRTHGIDLKKEMRDADIPMSMSELPFVYVYERLDLSTTLYGLQVYPETIKETLLMEAVSPFVTGRITLITKFDDAHDQYLEINIEMRRDKKASKAFASLLLKDIVKNLLLKNAEYQELTKFLGIRAEPRLVFWSHEDPLYFRRDTKQKWVIRTS